MDSNICVNCEALEKWKANSLRQRIKTLEAYVGELMKNCDNRTPRGTCFLIEKDDHTYRCNTDNCPFYKEAK